MVSPSISTVPLKLIFDEEAPIKTVQKPFSIQNFSLVTSHMRVSSALSVKLIVFVSPALIKIRSNPLSVLSGRLTLDPVTEIYICGTSSESVLPEFVSEKEMLTGLFSLKTALPFFVCDELMQRLL